MPRTPRKHQQEGLQRGTFLVEVCRRAAVVTSHASDASAAFNMVELAEHFGQYYLLQEHQPVGQAR